MSRYNHQLTSGNVASSLSGNNVHGSPFDEHGPMDTNRKKKIVPPSDEFGSMSMKGGISRRGHEAAHRGAPEGGPDFKQTKRKTYTIQPTTDRPQSIRTFPATKPSLSVDDIPHGRRRVPHAEETSAEAVGPTWGNRRKIISNETGVPMMYARSKEIVKERAQKTHFHQSRAESVLPTMAGPGSPGTVEHLHFCRDKVIRRKVLAGLERLREKKDVDLEQHLYNTFMRQSTSGPSKLPEISCDGFRRCLNRLEFELHENEIEKLFFQFVQAQETRNDAGRKADAYDKIIDSVELADIVSRFVCWGSQSEIRAKQQKLEDSLNRSHDDSEEQITDSQENGVSSEDDEDCEH